MVNCKGLKLWFKARKNKQVPRNNSYKLRNKASRAGSLYYIQLSGCLSLSLSLSGFPRKVSTTVHSITLSRHCQILPARTENHPGTTNSLLAIQLNRIYPNFPWVFKTGCCKHPCIYNIYTYDIFNVYIYIMQTYISKQQTLSLYICKHMYILN